MKKTMYIPKGQELRFENVTCERLVVAGSIVVDGTINAKHISGGGVISANAISADTVSAGIINAGKIVTDRLIAKRVTAVEVRAVQSMAVSSYISAGFVKSEKVTLTEADIDDLHAGEVIKLSVKRRSLLGMLFAAFIRSVWTEIFCSPATSDDGASARYDAVTEDYSAAEPSTEESGENAEAVAEAIKLMNDPEFLRLKAMYALADDSHIWTLTPTSEPPGRAVVYNGPNDPFADDENIAA